jgi:hypothetical protein
MSRELEQSFYPRYIKIHDLKRLLEYRNFFHIIESKEVIDKRTEKRCHN